MKVALHTRVHPDRIEEYEAAHREVPEELTAAIRAGGATSWSIHRSGQDLFHIIECEDYDRLIAHVGAQQVNTAWQERMTGLLEVVHDYSGGAADATLPLVWDL